MLRYYQVLYDKLIWFCQSCPLVNWLALHWALCPVNLKGLVNSPCTYEACPNMERKDLGCKPPNAHRPPSDIRTRNKWLLMRLLLEIAETIMRHWSSQVAYECLILIELLNGFYWFSGVKSVLVLLGCAGCEKESARTSCSYRIFTRNTFDRSICS